MLGGRVVGSIIALLLALGVILATGPRPRVDTSPVPPSVPHDAGALVEHLETQEAGFDDVVPGTAKRVLWADPDRPRRTEVALVYLHGFSATHRETAPLTEHLVGALGANAFLTRLTGHGRTGEALGDATATEWLRDTAHAIEVGRALGEKLVLIGVSTGGALATWAATRPDWSQDLSAVILMSPNYRLRDSRAWILTMPWGAHLASLIQGPTYRWIPRNEGHRLYWTEEYPVRALTEVAAITQLVTPQLAATLEVPTLVFLAANDPDIEPAAVRAAFARFPAKPKEMVMATEIGSESDHVLAGDILSPGSTAEVAERIVTFLEGL